MRYFQHLADDVVEPVAGFEYAAGDRADLWARNGLGFAHHRKQIGITKNLGKRGTQFVRGNGDEIGLNPIHLFELFVGFGQGLVERADFLVRDFEVGDQTGIGQRHRGLIGDGLQQVEVTNAIGVAAFARADGQNAGDDSAIENRDIDIAAEAL